jgi:hypothetical protein
MDDDFELVIEERKNQGPTKNKNKSEKINEFEIPMKKPRRKNTEELIAETERMLEESAAFLDLKSPLK